MPQKTGVIPTDEKNKFIDRASDNEVAVKTDTFVSNPSGLPVPTTANAATTHKIYNLSAPTAGTPVSQALTSNTKALMIRVRGNAKAQYSFVSAGETGTKFITIPAGSSSQLTGLDFTGKTLYIQTDKNAQVIELEELS